MRTEKRKRFFILIIAVICLTILSVTCCACNDGEVDGKADTEVYTEGLDFQLNGDGNGYTVSGIGEATDTDIIIPSKYSGLAVTYVNDGAFKDDEKITSVTINGDTVLKERAFAGCLKLKTVTIKGGEIGDSAFFNCSSLENAVLDDNVTEIKEDAFYGCTKLKEVHLGSGLQSIADMAFNRCVKIAKVYYNGTEEDRANIKGEEMFNSYLFNAEWVYLIKSSDAQSESENV